MNSENKKVKWNKNIIIVILVAVIFIIICSIALYKKMAKETIAGNFNNMGLVAENGGEIFYNKYEEGIVKIKGKEEFQITDETAYSMNIVGDTIYYLTISDTNTIDIKSVKTNGDSLKKIKTISTSIIKIYVKDGFIYYATNKDVGGIAKINIETSEENTITPATIQDFVIDNDMIYFTDNTNAVYSVNLNGLALQKINVDAGIKKMQIMGKWIYFYDETENALCRVKKKGGTKKIVSTFVNNEMYNVTSKNIYYYDDMNKQICKTKPGGKKSKAIVSLQAVRTRINIVDGVIYYLDASKNEMQIYQMYRVKENGKEAKIIEYENSIN